MENLNLPIWHTSPTLTEQHQPNSHSLSSLPAPLFTSHSHPPFSFPLYVSALWVGSTFTTCVLNIWKQNCLPLTFDPCLSVNIWINAAGLDCRLLQRECKGHYAVTSREEEVDTESWKRTSSFFFPPVFVLFCPNVPPGTLIWTHQSGTGTSKWETHTHTSEVVSRIPAAKPEKLVMRNRTARSHTHSAFECVREFLTVLSTCILYLNAVLWYSVSSRTFSVFFFRRIQYMMRKDWTQPLGIYFFFLSWVSLLICFGFSFFLSGIGFVFFFWPSGICSLFLFFT